MARGSTNCTSSITARTDTSTAVPIFRNALRIDRFTSSAKDSLPFSCDASVSSKSSCSSGISSSFVYKYSLIASCFSISSSICFFFPSSSRFFWYCSSNFRYFIVPPPKFSVFTAQYFSFSDCIFLCFCQNVCLRPIVIAIKSYCSVNSCRKFA